MHTYSKQGAQSTLFINKSMPGRNTVLEADLYSAQPQKRGGPGKLRKIYGMIFVLVVVLLTTTGCQFAQSSFTLMTSNAGATFAAASLSLRYAHERNITNAYARSSFNNYQSQLQGLDQQMPQQGASPDMHTVQTLLKLYRPAMQAINNPCLNTTCDWHAQLAALDRASQAFLKAGGQ